MNKILEIVVLIAIVGLAVFSGYQWSESNHANKVSALNNEIYELGVKLQNASNKTAELNRKLKLSNRGRINAITTSDHSSERVKQLQKSLDVAVKRASIDRRNYNYIVLSVMSVKRVYDEARNECDGLPDSRDSAIIPGPLSQFTGDSITGVVRELVGRYCEVATDYNSLYETCETLLTQ